VSLAFFSVGILGMLIIMLPSVKCNISLSSLFLSSLFRGHFILIGVSYISQTLWRLASIPMRPPCNGDCGNVGFLFYVPLLSIEQRWRNCAYTCLGVCLCDYMVRNPKGTRALKNAFYFHSDEQTSFYRADSIMSMRQKISMCINNFWITNVKYKIYS
jgi:hypothetical protein